ncbi:hypothetical protein L7F22_014833 [Adiantum nelumboides]|nr:hypothetical protein [Adiantum nelumboides]
MASGEGHSNPSTSGDAGGDHNKDYGNEHGPPLPTQEELREMEHRRLVGEATNMMLNFAEDPKLAKYMIETAFQGVHAQWKATTTSPLKPDSRKQYSEKQLEEEELVMLDPSIIYGGGDTHDQHRDMRLDVDNMTYEELLALEERIGNVNTGLDEEKIALSLRESKYSSLDATVAAISQDSDIKCSVCQEEFVEEDELGRLDCGHGYHSVCIKQWLLQKNECPICKASAYMKP